MADKTQYNAAAGNPPPYPYGGPSPVPHGQPTQPYGQPAAVQYMQPVVQPVQVAPAPVIAMQVGPNPMRITCPSCRSEVMTTIEKKASHNTHMAAFLLCLFCCPLMCVPYCADCYAKTEHGCPNCRAFVGTYQE